MLPRNTSRSRDRECHDLLPRAGTFIADDGTAYAEYERAALAAREELDGILLQLIETRRNAPQNQTHDVLSLIVHTPNEHADTPHALKGDGFSVRRPSYCRDSPKALPEPLDVSGRVLVAVQDQPTGWCRHGYAWREFSLHPFAAATAAWDV